MFGEYRNNHDKYFLTITFASVFSLLFVVGNDAYAMGPPPYACSNLYDSVFTSIWIQSEGITYNPVLTPGVVIPVQNGVGYKVNYTLHTSPASVGVNTWTGITATSVYGPNTQPGSTWFWTSGDLGIPFMQAECVSAGPNMDITSPTLTDNPHSYEGAITPSSWGTSFGGVPNYAGQTLYFLIWQNSPVTSPPTDAPRNLSAYALSSSRIDLYWDAPIINSPQDYGIPGYMIERSTDNGNTWTTIVTNTNSTTTTYSDAGLSPNTAYTYRVSAINSVGISSPSNTAATTTSS